jgi:hypothetical protein
VLELGRLVLVELEGAPPDWLSTERGHQDEALPCTLTPAAGALEGRVASQRHPQ